MNSQFYYRPGPSVLGLSGTGGSREDIKSRATNVRTRLWFAMNKLLQRSSLALSRSQDRTQALFPEYRALSTLFPQLITNIDNTNSDATAENLLADFTGRVAVFTASVANLIDVVTPSAPGAQSEPQIPPEIQTPPMNIAGSSSSSHNITPSSINTSSLSPNAQMSKYIQYGAIAVALAAGVWLFVRSR